MKLKIGLLILVGLFVLPHRAAAAPSTLSVGNEFIKIIVNNETEDRGRFAVETTQGDPQNPRDNNQSLIFGRPKPWTSYTTIKIDDTATIFGGKTRKRAGLSGAYGEVVSQQVLADSIITVCKYPPGITVTQTLTLIRNPQTRVKDTAKITYDIVNTDRVAHAVGARIMLDALLGQNDGAPFRIGTDAVGSEILYQQGQLQDYWQAFDDLSSPNIVAQGTLSLSEVGITPPDQLAVVNWGTLADAPWDFPYVPGRSFIRSGESEKDTAIALFFKPVVLKPGERRVVQTSYGLGGLTLSPGDLSLGLTAPAEVFASSKTPFLVVGYLRNAGGYDAQNTVVKWNLPAGFVVKKGNLASHLGTVAAGETRQMMLQVALQNPVGGIQKIGFSVESATLEPNTISRPIEVLAPPKLLTDISFSGRPRPRYPYVTANVTVRNPQTVALSDVEVQLGTASTAADLAWFEPAVKTIRLLPANSSETLSWVLRIKTDVPSAPIKVQSLTKSPLVLPQTAVGSNTVSLSTPTLEARPEAVEATVASPFYVTVFANPANPLQAQPVNLSYDAEILQFDHMTLDTEKLEISELKVTTGNVSWQYRPITPGPRCVLGFIYFHPIQSGSTQVILSDGLVTHPITITISEPITDSSNRQTRRDTP